jgi:hypothetical protein
MSSQAHRVVIRWAYRYVQYPSHSGIALVLTGTALACDDMLSLAAVAALGGADKYGPAVPAGEGCHTGPRQDCRSAR